MLMVELIYRFVTYVALKAPYIALHLPIRSHTSC